MTRVTEDSLGQSCPPALRELLRAVDFSYQKAAGLSGLSASYVANLARARKSEDRHAGTEAMRKIQNALTRIRGGEEKAALSPTPEFEPWDQKARAVVIPKKNARTKRTTMKNVPSMLADLIEKYNGNFAAAGRAAGIVGTTVQLWAEEGPSKFNEKRQRQIFAALNGTLPTGLSDIPDEPDRYTLGLAIVQVQAKNFDRINDVAELLNGRLVFRLNTGAGWLLVYRMKAEEDLKKFKRIAVRDSGKIVCP